MLDDGRLTDGQGNTINFKNTVIIATSNAGFGQQDTETSGSNIMDRIAPYFRPEFLNRFNSIIKFNHLQKENLEEIVDLMLAEVNQTTAKKGISLTIADDAKAHLIDLGYNHAMGARPLRRIIEQEIRDRITDYYLDHPEVKKLQAILKEGQLVIKQKDQ